jgi:acyl carrier protein
MSTQARSDARTRAEIEIAVIRAVAQVVRKPIGDVRLTSRLDEDLGLDSLGLIHASISVERELGDRITISEAPDEALGTVQDLVDLVAAAATRARTEVPSC